MGRSPVLATLTVMAVLSELATTSSLEADILQESWETVSVSVWSLGKKSFSTNGAVDRDKFAAVRKGTFHLHFAQHLRDTFHHIIAAKNRRAVIHQF